MKRGEKAPQYDQKPGDETERDCRGHREKGTAIRVIRLLPCGMNNFCSISAPLRNALERSLENQRLSITRIDAIDAKFFICNLRSISQAGRRGFDSRLPLQFKALLINWLSEIDQAEI